MGVFVMNKETRNNQPLRTGSVHKNKMVASNYTIFGSVYHIISLEMVFLKRQNNLTTTLCTRTCDIRYADDSIYLRSFG